jgi:sporulation-control protein spo0M
MSLKHKSSRLAVGVAAVIIGLGGAAAFGYWTSSGEGNATVTASSGGAGFEVTGTAEGLYPGGSVEGKLKVKNKDAKQGEYLTALTTSVEKTSAVGCEKTWFEITVNGTQEPKTVIAAGETKEYPVTVKMKEEAAVNQNACKSATVTLKAAAS